MLLQMNSDDTANDDFDGGIAESDEDESKACANEYPMADTTICVFRKPMMNFKASTYYNLTYLSQ